MRALAQRDRARAIRAGRMGWDVVGDGRSAGWSLKSAVTCPKGGAGAMTVMLYTDSTHLKKRPVVLCAAKVRKEPHNPGDKERVRWRSEGFHKRNRPKPAIHRLFEMLQRSPSLQTFVHRAAFSRLKGRFADKVSFRCICANVRSGEPFNKRSIPPVTETSEF